MDRINELPDELLIKILSFLPTKIAVSTCILSKRWEGLWRWLPKLEFTNRYGLTSKSKSFVRFLNTNLPLHRAPVIESFCLNLRGSRSKPQDIKLWAAIAISRCLLKLKIDYDGNRKTANILPSSLYICKSLVSLKLNGEICLDVPRMACLPSLKTLQLRSNSCLDGESLRRLLCICPVLEDLLVNCRFDTVITIAVPSLQRLSLFIPEGSFVEELVIDTPSLKYLELENHNEERWENRLCVIQNMPNLEEAYVVVALNDLQSLIGSITSVKRLTLCSEVVYGDGFVFNQLEHLKLCVCKMNSMKLLAKLLEDSPNLQVLDIFEMDHDDHQRDAIDESLMSRLKKFDWSRYLGRPQKKDLEVYIFEESLSLEDHKTRIL